MAEEKVKDIAQEAENVILRLKKDGGGKLVITKSQIRKFLAAVNALTNKVDDYRARNPRAVELSPELASAVKYLKVQLVYQAARNQTSVQPFVKQARLKERIDSIGTDLRAYEDFAHYVEALVAYHKFYGGED